MELQPRLKFTSPLVSLHHVSPKFNRIGSEAKGHFRLERYVGTKYTIDLMKIICDLDSAYERLMKNAFAQQDETAIEVFKGHHPSLPIELSIRFLPHQDPSKFTNRQRIYSRERYLAMWRIDIGPLKDRVAPTHLLWTCAVAEDNSNSTPRHR